MSNRPRKRVLITGASSGIGLSAAERFSRAGYDVAMIARGEGLKVAAARVREQGGRAYEIRADVGDHDALEEAIAAAAGMLGGLDVAVLNVGIGTFGTFEELTKEDFDRVMEVTFTATVDATRMVLPLLEEGPGTIVYTGSIAGQMPIPMMSSYTAAKHALRGFAGALRSELRTRGSSVNICIVSPGPVDTPFWPHVGTPANRAPSSAPPLAAYDTGSVSAEILRVAEHPRREVTVGGAYKLARAVYAAGGPVTEAAFGLVMRWKIGKADGEPYDRRSLARPSGEGMTGGGSFGRPSLLGAAHMIAGRLRQNFTQGS